MGLPRQWTILVLPTKTSRIYYFCDCSMSVYYTAMNACQRVHIKKNKRTKKEWKKKLLLGFWRKTQKSESVKACLSFHSMYYSGGTIYEMS